MKLILFLLSLLLFSSGVLSQEKAKPYSVRWRIGYYSFSMKELQTLNDEFIQDYQSNKIGVHQTARFPAYVGFMAEFYFNTAKTPYGFFVEHTSTGSRLTYDDYSGSLTLDQLVRRNSLGILTEKNIFTKGRITVLASLHVSLFMNTLTLKKTLSIGESTDKNSTQFWSLGIGVEPGITLRKRVKNLLIGMYFAYQFDVAITDLREKKSGQKLSTRSSYANPEWEGLRSGISVGMNF